MATREWLTKRLGHTGAPRRFVGAAIASLFVASGARWRALRYLDEHRCVICVCFHNPTRETFENLVAWLQRHNFTFVSQEQLLTVIHTGATLPPRAVWFVFDDGWKGLLVNVLPVLRKHRIPATIAISPGETETEQAWPTLAIDHGSGETSFKCMSGQAEQERARNAERLRVAFGSVAERPLLSIQQIQELAADPLITIENHTYDHVYAVNCTTEEFRLQVRLANERIREWVGRSPTILFYPFGSWIADLDDLLPECGLEASANSGNVLLNLETQASPFAIPRIAIPDNASTVETTCRLTKAWLS
jgi:peptidoglycan/xylan/chitin deacetylase (PgdA/CDA1 family)